ncbi:DUF4349 domain-containing protein [Flavobacterium sp. N1719]|uniref:DUF4349 domain-containing protein n=1 Tax=Flavobacterium sp. N1719 TaxID=2885633 RepID=UPI002221902D|nr:DUF4349 domain-containing protein [Flavobacterium sp. N1719]
MKKRTIPLVGLFIWLTTLSCKQHENAVKQKQESETAVATDSVSSNTLTTAAAVEPKNSTQKFVRTGDVRIRVKDVVQSTQRIENAVSSAGGMITHTKMESVVDDRKETVISQDSVLVTQQYHTENEMILRVPNAQLNTVLQSISKEVEYVDYRTIDAENVTAQFLANELEQQRKKESSTRLQKGIDQRSAKLNQVVEAENAREVKASEKDTKIIENIQLNDKASYATLALKLYQNSAIKQERLARMEISERLRPSFGFRAWQNVKTGWFALESTLSFLLLFWPVGLLGGLGYIGYKKLAQK